MKLEDHKKMVFEENWIKKMSTDAQTVITNGGNYYNPTSLRDLLRCFRNFLTHDSTFISEEIIDLFTKPFPKLLVVLFDVAMEFGEFAWDARDGHQWIPSRRKQF